MVKEGRKDAEEETEKEEKFRREKRMEGNRSGNTARERWKSVEMKTSVNGKKEKPFPKIELKNS